MGIWDNTPPEIRDDPRWLLRVRVNGAKIMEAHGFFTAESALRNVQTSMHRFNAAYTIEILLTTKEEEGAETIG